MNGSDLIFNNEIVLEGDVMPDDWIWEGDSAFSARMVREALTMIGGPVTIRVNSAGGAPTEGEAIRAAIAAHGHDVTVIVAGLAASAASLMIMSATRIEMTAGSILMVHDPSTCMCGNSGELRQEAERLDLLSETYATVYADRAGMPVEEMRELMRAETWMGPQDAVDAGLADAIQGQPKVDETGMIAATAAHAATLNTLRMRAGYETAVPDSPAPRQAGRSGQSPAMSATTLETEMEPEIQTPENAPAPAAAPANDPPATPATTMQAPATPPAPPAAPAAPTPETTMRGTEDGAGHESGIQAERTRQREIREMAAPFVAAGQVTSAQVDALINDGTATAMASQRLLSTMAGSIPANEPPAGAPAALANRVHGDRDPSVEGLIAAMMRDYSGPGAQFRGLRVRGLAMHLAGSARGYSDAQSVRAGMMATTMTGGAHGVSDFAYITSEVMNRTLLAEYERRGDQWNLVTGTPMTAADFREMHAARFGGDFQLKEVQANGEYKEATLADEAEGLTVKRKGRTINITFEAVVNDNMGAFQRIPREFATAARIMENAMVWGLFRDNTALKSDSTALFHADHNNLNSGGAGVINVTRVGAGRKAMWEQRAFGTTDTDDFLMLSPDRLLVPPALEVTAGQFVRPITPAKDSDANPYKDTLTPHTVPNLGAAAGGSDTAWYLISSDLPPVSAAYLEGYESPTIQTREAMNPDKITMDARHVFGAANTEFRGAQKNNGA